MIRGKKPQVAQRPVSPVGAGAKTGMPVARRTGLFRRIGRAAALGLLGTALSVGAVRALSSKKVPLEKERKTIAQIYKLSETNASDKRVLDLIDRMAKENGISRGKVLRTLEQNVRDDFQVKAIDARLENEKNPSERARLLRIRGILVRATSDEKLEKKLTDVFRQRGTLNKVQLLLSE